MFGERNPLSIDFHAVLCNTERSKQCVGHLGVWVNELVHIPTDE